MKRTFTLCHAIDNDPTKKKIISQSNQDRPRDSSINMILSYSKSLKPSKRGELEITDLLKKYLSKNKLSADFIGRGGAWLDTGSIEDFYKTSAFVSAIENRQDFKIACLEEISFLNKWIGKKEVQNSIKFYGNCSYSNYLKKLIQ